MYHGKYVFSQLFEFLPKYEFEKCVNRYQGNYKNKGFTCRNQFLAMSFGQLTNRESLRDTVNCLAAHQQKLYHFGITYQVNLSTLALANETRDWRIYSDLAQVLLARARKLYLDDGFGLDIPNTVYALDATTLDLCLSVFWWLLSEKPKLPLSCTHYWIYAVIYQLSSISPMAKCTMSTSLTKSFLSRAPFI